MTAGVKASLGARLLMPLFSILENSERQEDHSEPAAMWKASQLKPLFSLAAN